MDIELFFTEAGSGTPLILLHGNGEDGTYFAPQIAPLARHFRVIALDTRGHGQSPRGNAPFTIGQFARDLRDFMDAQGIERASLLGFSDGGNIALAFALDHPERVDRLILNGANLDPSGVKPSVQIPIVLGYGLAAALAPLSPRAGRKAELLRLMVREPRIRPSELGSIAAPALVIAGTHDMIREKHTRLIAQSLSNARLEIIPGDHFIARTNPEEFRRAVEAFLLA